jgi:hypothetical protein
VRWRGPCLREHTNGVGVEVWGGHPPTAHGAPPA